MEVVSASDIVRQFGHWQDRARSAPIYIRHHGRPKFVLATVDFMERLVVARGDLDGSNAIEALLELIDTLVIVTDARQCVIGMSPVARHQFVRSDWHGQKLEDLLPDQLRAIVMRSVHHVRETGASDQFQLRTADTGQRRLEVSVRPFGDGVCIVGHDHTAGDARREVGALTDAVRQTMALLGTVAVVRVNLRGFITEATESFDTLTGLSATAYRSVRLPTLFDVSSRVAVSDAMERAIDRIGVEAADARMIVNRGEPRPVRIAFSGEMLRASHDAVIATIVACD